MKLTINTDERYAETEIVVNCCRMGDDIEKLLAAIRLFDMKCIGLKNGQQCFIDAAQIIYIESTDKRTFLYTSTDVYESPYRLYELEEKLTGQNFLRASKNCLFSVIHIQSLKSDLEQRLLLTMEENIKIIVSRQYSSSVKEKLEDFHG
jgi:DNA-binding LytR/AlgR family response regulator